MLSGSPQGVRMAIARLRYSQWAHQEYVKDGATRIMNTGALALRSHELEAFICGLHDRQTLDALYERYQKLRGERIHHCH